MAEILSLDHGLRQEWVNHIAAINRRLNDAAQQ